jgi:hypothetical protein
MKDLAFAAHQPSYGYGHGYSYAAKVGPKSTYRSRTIDSANLRTSGGRR